MHLLDFRTKLWSKLSIFVLAFVLAIFPNAAMAADDSSDAGKGSKNSSVADDAEDRDEDGDAGEPVSAEIDLEEVIRSTDAGELKQHLIEARNDTGQNYLHLIRLEQFDLFADSVGDDGVVGDMLLEYAKDNNPFSRFVVENPINPRFASLVTSPRSDKGDTLLMALAMRDADVADHLSTLASKGVSVNQADVFGNTAESIDDLSLYFFNHN